VHAHILLRKLLEIVVDHVCPRYSAYYDATRPQLVSYPSDRLYKRKSFQAPFDKAERYAVDELYRAVNIA
jgi:hypothetical protein